MRKICTLFLTSILITSCEFDEILSTTAVINEAPKSISQLEETFDSGLQPPITVDPDFIWGINGHPLNQEPYQGSIENQMQYLKEHQIEYYRVDFPVDTSGQIVSKNGFFPYSVVREATEFYGLDILPMIYLSGLDYNKSFEENFNIGKRVGAGFAQRYKEDFRYYELGNEQEIQDGVLQKTSTGGDQNGSVKEHYDLDKVETLAHYYKGMIKGIGDLDEDAKFVINIATGQHWGFLRLLIDHGVEFDITGYHWYSNIGSLLSDFNEQPMISHLEALGKDIWITEFNRDYGSSDVTGIQDNHNYHIDQADEIETFINEIAGINSIKAVFFYQLYDQPKLFESGHPRYAFSGIIDKDGNHKHGSDMLKMKIEEASFGYENFVYSLYLDLLLRTPLPNPLQYWTNRFNSIQSKKNFLNTILPEESYKRFVEQQYRLLFDREGDNGGINYWTEDMKNGRTRESLIKVFCISDEFSNLSGNTNEGFVNRLYEKLLNSDTQARGDHWVNELNAGISKSTVVGEFLKSEEFIKKFIWNQYSFLLNREPDQVGAAFWLEEMRFNDLTQQSLIKKVLLSKEYWDKAMKEGYVRKNSSPFSYN